MKFVMDERVKYRITGLVVIISIAAIFLPAMLKKSNQRFEENVNLSVRLPDKPIAPKVAMPAEKTMFKSIKVAHVTVPSVTEVPRITHIVKAEPLSSKSVVSASANRSVSLARMELVSGPAAKAAIASKKSVNAVKKEVYAVQLASFSQQKNAQSLVTRLRKNGYTATYSKFNNKQGEFYKVIVGSLNQKNEAINLQKKLATRMQLKGFIIKTEVS